MKEHIYIPIEEMRKLFTIDPSVPSGLRWKVSPAKNIKPGRMAGSGDGGGYYQVKVNSIKYRTHRIIWSLVNGEIPEGLTIDHKDRNTKNNDIKNLRLATMAQQSINRKRKKQGSLKTFGNGRIAMAIVINGVYFSKSGRDRKALENWVKEKIKCIAPPDCF